MTHFSNTFFVPFFESGSSTDNTLDSQKQAVDEILKEDNQEKEENEEDTEDQSSGTKEKITDPDKAAAKIQAGYRGLQTRRDLKKQREQGDQEASEEKELADLANQLEEEALLTEEDNKKMEAEVNHILIIKLVHKTI